LRRLRLRLPRLRLLLVLVLVLLFPRWCERARAAKERVVILGVVMV
jgi:hypothetical protein